MNPPLPQVSQSRDAGYNPLLKCEDGNEMGRLLHRQGRLLALAALLWMPLAMAEAPVEHDVEWMALLLDGQKTGWLRTERAAYDDRVESTEQVHLKLARSGVTIEMTTEDRVVETAQGKPLSFTSTQAISGGRMTLEGTIDNGTATVTTISGGSRQSQTFPWPDGARMAEGLRLAMQQHGLEPGTSFTTKAFIPSSLQATDVEVLIGETEPVDIFGVEMDLVRTEQVMDLGNTQTRIITWVDQDLNPKKMRFSIMGMALETIACPEECARAETEPAEFFTQAFVRSPVPIADDTQAITYVIQPRADADIHFPDSQEQSARERPDGAYEVTIRARPNGTPVEVEPAEHLGQTRWLQTESDEIVRLARQARGDTQDPAEVMSRLERFVRGYVSSKDLSVGYASALETARSRTGDCTEHALLLAALGRASGIPTRIATGVAYVGSWLGAQDVFVPHAWVQALIDGQWVSYDAALGGFDIGHLALSYGDGDPWHFYDGVNTLGNFTIESVAVAAP